MVCGGSLWFVVVGASLRWFMVVYGGSVVAQLVVCGGLWWFTAFFGSSW